MGQKTQRMIKQRHYHGYMLFVSLMLIASGGLLVVAWQYEWNWMAWVGCIAICLYIIYIMWQGASFLPDQVKYFLGCLRSKDTMSRFPDTHDADLKQMYADMNLIMQKYGQSQMELETKRMYYDRILRIMTHELRNSITPIISLSEDMLQREYAPEDSREAVEVIHEQCTSIKTFLDSYYELTHLPKPEIREVDAKSLLQHVERLYPDLGISIECAQGLKLQCDESQIKQLMINLVKNAIEAMGNKKMIELKNERIPAVMITASAPEGNPRITVSDRGPGIPADKREEIFLPFYTSKTGGSGIGLALSRQIMNLHKGMLTCSGNEQGGAMFILQF